LSEYVEAVFLLPEQFIRILRKIIRQNEEGRNLSIQNKKAEHSVMIPVINKIVIAENLPEF
jgi:hypothetical protein